MPTALAAAAARAGARTLRLADGPKLGRLNDYLLDVLLPRFQIVLSYDPGFGLRVERGNDLFASWPALKEIGELPALPLPALRAVARFLQYARNLRAVGAKPVSVAVVLRDAQLYVPVLPQTMNHELSAIASLIRMPPFDQLKVGRPCVSSEYPRNRTPSPCPPAG